MLTTHSSLPNQAVAMARTDSQEMHTLLTCAEPVQLQQADPAMLKSMAAVGVLGVKTRPRIPSGGSGAASFHSFFLSCSAALQLLRLPDSCSGYQIRDF
jgi:hypothetical protein